MRVGVDQSGQKRDRAELNDLAGTRARGSVAAEFRLGRSTRPGFSNGARPGRNPAATGFPGIARVYRRDARPVHFDLPPRDRRITDG